MNLMKTQGSVRWLVMRNCISVNKEALQHHNSYDNHFSREIRWGRPKKLLSLSFSLSLSLSLSLGWFSLFTAKGARHYRGIVPVFLLQSRNVQLNVSFRHSLLTFGPEFHMDTCIHAFARLIASHKTVNMHDVTANHCTPISPRITSPLLVTCQPKSEHGLS